MECFDTLLHVILIFKVNPFLFTYFMELGCMSIEVLCNRQLYNVNLFHMNPVLCKESLDCLASRHAPIKPVFVTYLTSHIYETHCQKTKAR